MRVSTSVFKALKRKQAAKKAKRLDNAIFIRKISGRPKLPSIVSLRKKLWDLNTTIIKRRDGLKCCACNLNEGYAQNHIVPQQEGDALRYDLDNIFWGCRACNMSEKNYRGRWQRIVFPELFGAEFIEALWARSRQTVQLRRPDLERMIGEREELLRTLPKNGQ